MAFRQLANKSDGLVVTPFKIFKYFFNIMHFIYSVDLLI